VTQVRVASSHRDEYVALLESAGVSVVESAQVVLADPVLVNTLDLESARWIQSTWAGVDAIDWSRVPPDAVVTTLPGVFGPQIAEFVFAYLLGRTQRVPERHESRIWDETAPGTLAGSSLGILGAGSIGSAIAEVGRVFGMTVRGCRRSGLADSRYDRMYSLSDVDEFAEDLEHLVVVLPATPETHDLVDGHLLDRLRHWSDTDQRRTRGHGGYPRSSGLCSNWSPGTGGAGCD
jgi:phosphoglycerate dehydrogenase-like enzyme